MLTYYCRFLPNLNRTTQKDWNRSQINNDLYKSFEERAVTAFIRKKNLKELIGGKVKVKRIVILESMKISRNAYQKLVSLDN